MEDRGVEHQLANEQLSGFDIKLPLASQNELGVLPLFMIQIGELIPFFFP